MYPSEEAEKQLESLKQLVAKEEQEALVGKFVEKFKCKHVSSQRAARTITSVCGKFNKIEKITPLMHFGSKNVR